MARAVKAEGLMASMEEPIDIEAIHREHADFLWATLFRMGVAEADLPDLLQEVLVVVHRRRKSWTGLSSIRTWLYGICLRLAKNYRRKAHRRRERVVASISEEKLDTGRLDPEQVAMARDAKRQARRLLDELAPERRAVLVMFEVEELSCEEIAEILGIKVGTVYSRLHTARKEMCRAYRRMMAREQGAR